MDTTTDIEEAVSDADLVIEAVPKQVVGLHFFNPPVRMDLVEVTDGEATSDETAELAHEWAESVDKTPIYVRKDGHGFVANTVLVPFMEEAAWMLSNDETTVQEADATMVYERGYPMGAFELNDFAGIDIAYHYRDSSDYPVPPVLKRKSRTTTPARKAVAASTSTRTAKVSITPPTISPTSIRFGPRQS